MSKTPKFYVVWKGRETGIFKSWDECSAQVTGFAGAQYKAFEDYEAAVEALMGDYADYKGKDTVSADPTPQRIAEVGQPLIPSYAVDAACAGYPGPVEYRCVETGSRREVFRQGPFACGTNNIGEFLAIVHALALFQTQGIDLPIYSDSRNAIGWVREGRCKTNLLPDDRNVELFDLIARAEAWLAAHPTPHAILKWESDVWGENPADYGRK
jgi:ribonuclease HI